MSQHSRNNPDETPVHDRFAGFRRLSLFPPQDDYDRYADEQSSAGEDDQPIVTVCCGAAFYEPGWPDGDICSECKEYSEPAPPLTVEEAKHNAAELRADARRDDGEEWG
jgi:hypothetical protein